MDRFAVVTNALILLTLLATSRVAHADVVLPPPENCPRGKVPTSSHGGQECVDPAPKKCPPGHRGVIRGQCVLHFCRDDSACGAGQRCREAHLCYAPHEIWWEYRRSVPARDKFAAPPRKLDQPKTVWDATTICQREGDCLHPAECRPNRLCFPEGYAVPPGPPPRPDAGVPSGDGAPPPATTSDPPPGGFAEPPPTAAPTPTGPPPPPPPNATDPPPTGSAERPGGCGKGCTTTSPAGLSVSALLLTALLAVGLVRRRRKAGRPA